MSRKRRDLKDLCGVYEGKKIIARRNKKHTQRAGNVLVKRVSL